MLITLFINIIVSIIGAIFWIVPTVAIPTAWASSLSLAIGYWNSFMLEIPFLVPLWEAFLWIIGFELSLLVLKFFLGHRLPVNN